MASIRRKRITIPNGKRAKAASRCHRSGEWTRAGYRAPACYVTNILGKTDGHVFYTILGEPEPPWVNNKITNQNAWVSALEVVCSNSWAKGETSCENAAKSITTAIFLSGSYQYETNSGSAAFFDSGSFLLSDFLAALSLSSPVDVNCSDCARAVTSLANLVGCSLWSSRMFDPSFPRGFETNPYCAIGRDPWSPPSWGWGFSFHEVAWAGDATSANLVYDACLQYDGDDTPSALPGTPIQPTSIPFSDGSPNPPLVYRERLTPPGADGYDHCIAQPTSKRRLPVQ